MSTYVPPSRRVYHIKSHNNKNFKKQDEFPELSTKDPITRILGDWSTNINIENLKELKKQPVKPLVIQKIVSLSSITEEGDINDTDYGEDDYHTVVEDEEAFTQDVINYGRS
ncbi:MAG: hypothetical protein ACTSYR_00165 [Candidatus Odinarchaeia archaeon]